MHTNIVERHRDVSQQEALWTKSLASRHLVLFWDIPFVIQSRMLGSTEACWDAQDFNRDTPTL